jgi:hypothetical protein
MIKKIWLVLCIPVALYSLQEEQKKMLKKAFQEIILDHTEWDSLLTKEGQEEFLQCIKTLNECNIPLMLDDITRFFRHDKCRYATVNDNFQTELNNALDDPEKIKNVMDSYLEKYLTPEGRKNFCTPQKRNSIRLGSTLIWLKKMSLFLYQATHKSW